MTTQVDSQAQKNSREFVDSRWFSWLDLLLVLLAGVMWSLGQGRLTWQPLLVAVVPWIIRLVSGRFPFRRTPFEFPMLLFLISAAVGVWAAYNSQAAWDKFWLIVGAVFLFYALAGQPKDNLWPIVGFLGFSGLVAGGYFLLAHDWVLSPAKIRFVNQMLLQWMDQRPAVNFAPLPANVAASLVAISLPLLVAWGAHASFKNRKVINALVAIVTTIIIVVLFLTTSRGAWMAVGVAFVIGLMALFSKWIANRVQISPRVVMVILILLALVAAGIVIALYPGGTVAIMDLALSPPSAAERYSLYISSINLIRDFPITGSGLASFAGLYSQYILVIPYFFWANGHNVLSDIALEQGPLGFISMAIIFLGSLVLLAKGAAGASDLQSEKSRDWLLLRLGITASLIVMFVHGFFEDTIYGSQFTMLFFVLPGLAMASAFPREETKPDRQLHGGLVAGVTLLLLLILAGAFFLTTGQSPRSTWQSNLGALEMTKAELIDWPIDQWDNGSNVAALEPARALLEESLVDQPDNRTAHYRLGLISFSNRDFDEAVTHLEEAYELGGPHKGIRKALAFNYVWADRYDKAMPLMAEVPEAEYEMGVYAWWWRTQGRDDLADAAGEMAQRLRIERETRNISDKPERN